MPVSVDVAKLAVEGRTGGSLAGVLVEARIGEGQCIDLVFRSPEFRETKHELADSVAFVATETLLGEELLDCWIGVIATAPLPKAGWLSKLRGGEGTRALPLERLRPTVLALIGSLIDQLPDQPCHTLLGEDSNWSLVELQPDDQDDYVERTDLCVAVTGRLEMWKAAHSGGIFHSGRFSRHGETFCYLKLDGSQGLGDSPFADRGDIEDALNDALRPTALGCVVGGGTGRRYSYIDLALTDCALAVPLIRDTLQSGRVPHRTWLQFFDDEFSKEWVGIYDDSPPPPL